MKHLRTIAAFVLSFAMLLSVMPMVANASALQNDSDTMSSQKINAASTHSISFDLPNALTGGDDIVITFPSDFDFSGVVGGDITATGATVALSGTENRIITLTYAGGITGGSTVTVTIGGSSALNPSTATTYSIDITADNGDTGDITVPILNDDQVIVTATVNQSLNFAVSDNSVGFGTLTTANARYATTGGGSASEPTNAHTLTAGTNATSGYTIAIEGDTLTSGSDTIDRIGDATAITAGTEQFGLDVDYASGGSSGNLTVEAPFDDYGMTDVAGTAETLVTQDDATDDNTFDVNYVANIGSATEAGNYSTTFTYTMTANF